jgi:hypothetical protein
VAGLEWELANGHSSTGGDVDVFPNLNQPAGSRQSAVDVASSLLFGLLGHGFW